MKSDDGITLQELLEIFGDSPADLIKIRYLKARTHKQRVQAVDAAIDWAVSELAKTARHHLQASEDSLTLQIVINLKAMGFQASHDTDVGGHCDIVIEGRDGFLWLAEAKIHGNYPWLLKGFRQLTERYSTGIAGQTDGGLIIYSRRPRIDRMMKAWSKHLKEHERGVTVTACPKAPPAFISKQIHTRTGDEFKIRHVPVSLYFNPTDALAGGSVTGSTNGRRTSRR